MNGLQLNNVVLGHDITHGVIHVYTHAINIHTCKGTYIQRERQDTERLRQEKRDKEKSL